MFGYLPAASFLLWPFTVWLPRPMGLIAFALTNGAATVGAAWILFRWWSFDSAGAEGGRPLGTSKLALFGWPLFVLGAHFQNVLQGNQRLVGGPGVHSLDADRGSRFDIRGPDHSSIARPYRLAPSVAKPGCTVVARNDVAIADAARLLPASVAAGGRHRVANSFGVPFVRKSRRRDIHRDCGPRYLLCQRALPRFGYRGVVWRTFLCAGDFDHGYHINMPPARAA